MYLSPFCHRILWNFSEFIGRIAEGLHSFFCVCMYRLYLEYIFFIFFSRPVLYYPLSLTPSQNDPKKGVAGEREHVAMYQTRVMLAKLQDLLNSI